MSEGSARWVRDLPARSEGLPARSEGSARWVQGVGPLGQRDPPSRSEGSARYVRPARNVRGQRGLPARSEGSARY